MGASVRTIKANVTALILTKDSRPTFVFNESNVDSNNKTINEVTKETNNNNNSSNNNSNNNNNVTDKDVFYEMAI